MRITSDNRINLRLPNIAVLFNSLNDSPFFERRLDADAEGFIVNCASELSSNPKLELVIQLSNPADSEQLEGVERIVRRHFANRAEVRRLEFRQLMRRGRLSLGIGVVFLATCLLLGGLVPGHEDGEAFIIIREGLTICGWVAMWRPLEIFLFDWWPIFEEQRRLNRLAQISVRFSPAESGSILLETSEDSVSIETRRVAA